MIRKVVTKEELLKKIAGLSGELEIIGMKKLPNKGVFYQPIASPDEIYLGTEFAVEPVKKFFLEPSIWLFKRSREDDFRLEPLPRVDSKRIIIGARPCEARGLKLLDKLFDNSAYKDNFYINNRKRTIIVALACAGADPSCFCTSTGSSPTEPEGADALLFEIEGRFIIEIISERAGGIFGSLKGDISEEDKNLLGPRKEKYKGLIKREVNVPEDLTGIYDNDYWDIVSRPCIGCGICTYLCPTCHCFDLIDEERKMLRCYDGCSFPDFTLEASGTNPRSGKRERYRQRVFHKFDYFKRNFGENLCVGCGRCVRFCPVKIDIADIVNKAPVKIK